MTRSPTPDFDDRLGDGLASLAEPAPMPPRLLDVPDASVRAERSEWVARRPMLAVAGVVTGAIVAVLVVLGLVGPLLQAPRVGDDGGPDASLPMERLDAEPRTIENPAIAGVRLADEAVGNVVQMARGRAGGMPFRLVAYRSGEGNCLWFEWGGQEGSGCAPLPERDPVGDGVIGMTLYRLDPTHQGYLVGLVAGDAARLQVRAEDGSRAEARLFDPEPAGIAAQAYLVFLPRGFAADRIEVTGADETPLTELELDKLLRGMPLPRARPLERDPAVIVVLRNHTDSRPVLRHTQRTHESEGEGWAPVDACDISTVQVEPREGLEWSVEVDGTVVLDWTTALPEGGVDSVVEVIVELRPGEAPTVGETSVRGIGDSTIGPASGRSPMAAWSERWWELGSGLECDWEADPDERGDLHAGVGSA